MKDLPQPKISVITCFYNVGPFLEEAVNSVINQHYQDWELILIDDGSTDNSTDIAKTFAANFEGRIFYIDHETHANKGASTSRNIGIAKAKGEWIAFLDADDVWLPEYLENQVEILQKHDVSLICEATQYWYSWNNPQADDAIIFVGAGPDKVYYPVQLAIELYPLGTGAAPCICGMLAKKSTIEKLGGFDDRFPGMYDDQAFLIKFYLNEKVFISSSCNNKYRQRPDSLVGFSQRKGGYYQVREKFLLWLKEYIRDSKINNADISVLVQKALIPPPLVSVIVTFLNEEKFIEETIQSVLNQDYPNWELLLVDDGSSDTSTNISKKYQSRYPGQIFYLEHENHQNKGLSASRNLGVKYAKGEYLAFLDADDIWLSNKISNQVRIFQDNPGIGMVAEGSIRWFSWSETGEIDKTIPVGVAGDRIYEPYQLLYELYPLGNGAAPGPCSWLLSKEAVHRAGGFEESFNKQFQLYEDQAFLCKIYLREKVYISSSFNNYYRQRQGSIVKRVTEEGLYHSVRRYFLEFLEKYLEQNNIVDHRLQVLIKKSLRPYRYPVAYFLFESAPKKGIRFLKESIPVSIKNAIKSRLKK